MNDYYLCDNEKCDYFKIDDCDCPSCQLRKPIKRCSLSEEIRKELCPKLKNNYSK